MRGLLQENGQISPEMVLAEAIGEGLVPIDSELIIKAAKKTGKAVEAGSFAVGKQLGKASGMFAAFKEEYDKAAHGGDGE